MEKYLKEHQLTQDIIERWGLKVGLNAISIPILSHTQQTLFHKTRHFRGNAKYTYDRGASASLFGSHLITKETTDVYIVEGEFKAIAVYENRDLFGESETVHIVAVSSTGGSRTWNDEWNEYIKGKRVHILYDNDKAGMEGAMYLWNNLSLSNHTLSIEVITTPDGYKDINDLLCDYKDILLLEEMIPESISLIGLTDKKRNNLKHLRGIIGLLNAHEFIIYTEKERKYLNLAREYVAKQYKNNIKQPEYKSDYAIEDMEAIRKIPITNFIRFTNNVASCIWHNDRHPSLHYNSPSSPFPNTVKCYSCGKFADVIETVMTLNNVDFKEALKILKGKN